jgi:hypothetical protein
MLAMLTYAHKSKRKKKIKGLMPKKLKGNSILNLFSSIVAVT